MNPNRVTFLVVDDDEVAVLAILRALDRHDIKSEVVLARDGVEALFRLRETYGPKPPFIILLDLNMPRMNGIEFLAELRKDAALRQTVVFVMTTSDAPEDISAAYAHQVAGYLVKEDAYRSIGTAIGMIEGYTRAVTLPT